ncbi:MAG: hypothetical protein I8H70_01315 [Burkholderiales bacterium]|nr:hypothetical protein [Burkholderiales bacterium]
MKHIVIKPVWAWLFMAAALMGSAHASTSAAEPGRKTVAGKAKKKAGSGGQIRFLPGSAETTKERGARLKRECKGGVNAGACSGYTN